MNAPVGIIRAEGIASALAQSEFAVTPELALAASVRRGLLAESVEILVSEGITLLSALRVYVDDDALVAQFRLVDTAFRTARACAIAIRDANGGA